MAFLLSILKLVFLFLFCFYKQVSPWPACLYTNINFARATRVSSSIWGGGGGGGMGRGKSRASGMENSHTLLQCNMSYMYYVVSTIM